MHREGLISIWFFIGVLLLIYGIIITIAELFMASPNVVLADLRPGVWWGVMLTVIGAIYTVKFRPGR